MTARESTARTVTSNSDDIASTNVTDDADVNGDVAEDLNSGSWRGQNGDNDGTEVLQENARNVESIPGTRDIESINGTGGTGHGNGTECVTALEETRSGSINDVICGSNGSRNFSDYGDGSAGDNEPGGAGSEFRGRDDTTDLQDVEVRSLIGTQQSGNVSGGHLGEDMDTEQRNEPSDSAQNWSEGGREGEGTAVVNDMQEPTNVSDPTRGAGRSGQEVSTAQEPEETTSGDAGESDLDGTVVCNTANAPIGSEGTERQRSSAAGTGCPGNQSSTLTAWSNSNTKISAGGIVGSRMWEI